MFALAGIGLPSRTAGLLFPQLIIFSQGPLADGEGLWSCSSWHLCTQNPGKQQGFPGLCALGKVRMEADLGLALPSQL